MGADEDIVQFYMTAWIHLSKAGLELPRPDVSLMLDSIDEAVEYPDVEPTDNEQAAERHLKIGIDSIMSAFYAHNHAEDTLTRYGMAEIAYIAGIALSLHGKPVTTSLMLQAAMHLTEDPERLRSIHTNLFGLYRRIGRVDDAIFHIEQAGRYGLEEHIVSCEKAGLLLAHGGYHEAESLYREILGAQPEDAVIQCNLGVALCRQDRYEEAIACMDRAQELEPKPLYQLNKAYVLTLSGNPRESLVLLQELKQQEDDGSSPQDVITRTINTGFAYHRLGNSTEAVRHYSEGVRMTHRHIEAAEKAAEATAVPSSTMFQALITAQMGMDMLGYYSQTDYVSWARSKRAVTEHDLLRIRNQFNDFPQLD